MSTYLRIPVNEIQLDLRNPRIARWIEMYGDKISAEQMSLALGAGAPASEDGNTTTFRSLRESIKTNGDLVHPIIVNREPKGLMTCIEGNTRVLIFREFLSQKAPGNWTTIPAMVYENLSQKEIDAIRLQSHLVGPRPWDPYSKARYLDLLSNSQHLTKAQIVEFCGGRQREVQDYIHAYHDMEKYYRPLIKSDQDFDPTRFSAFVELQNPRIQETLLATNFTLTDFARWVNEKLINPLNTVRALPRILRDPKARDIFLKEGAQEALKVLDVPSPDAALNEATLDQLAKEVVRRVNSLPWSTIVRLKANTGGTEVELIRSARDVLSELCTHIDGNE